MFSSVSETPGDAARDLPRTRRAPAGLASQPISVVPSTASIRSDVHAVVIGIGSYEADLPGLPSARNDAQLVRTYLRKMVGAPEENIRFLRDGEASYLSLKETFESWLPRRVRTDDLVLVYFAGHGVTDPGDRKAYLMPYDGRLGQARATGFELAQVRTYLEDLRTDRSVLMLDTCFSGEGRSVSAPGTRSAAVIIEGPLVAPAGRAKGARTVVLASAGSQQVAHSLDTEGHGLFTYYLLSALRGQGDREPSGNGDGWVDVSEAFAYLSREVDRRSRREFGRPQNPEMHPAQISDPIRLTRVP